MAVKHVHVTTTSLSGCKVEIDGDVRYGLIPPKLIGFHGAVHISGGEGCRNGDLYFGIGPEDKVKPPLPESKSNLGKEKTPVFRHTPTFLLVLFGLLGWRCL